MLEPQCFNTNVLIKAGCIEPNSDWFGEGIPVTLENGSDAISVQTFHNYLVTKTTLKPTSKLLFKTLEVATNFKVISRRTWLDDPRGRVLLGREINFLCLHKCTNITILSSNSPHKQGI